MQVAGVDYTYNGQSFVLGTETWTPPQAFLFHGVHNVTGTLTTVAVATESQLSLQTQIQTHALTFSATQNSFTYGTETWTPGWKGFGEYQYSSVRYPSGTSPAHKEPWLRWNSFGGRLIGDRDQAVVSNFGSGGNLVWSAYGTWGSLTPLTQFVGTFQALPAGSGALEWTGDTWSLVTMEATVVTQELRRQDWHTWNQRLSWYQDGVLQDKVFVPRGSYLLNYLASGTPSLAADKAATYDESTGTLTWASAYAVWTKRGTPPRLPGQQLTFQPGSSGVLYLHMDGASCSGLSSIGPGKHTNCVMKLSLTPGAPVSHMAEARQHRFIEIPQGCLSYLQFFIRTPAGEVVDLHELGSTISFVATICPRS